MSIEEDYKEIKSSKTSFGSEKGLDIEESESLPTEEEFEIVRKGQKRAIFSRDMTLVGFIMILIVLLAFGIGRLSTLRRDASSIKIEYPDTNALQGTSLGETSPQVRGTSTINTKNSTVVVASKSGTKYHFPWCSGAKRIIPSNKITFSSPKEARAAGYAPAANCKGLE